MASRYSGNQYTASRSRAVRRGFGGARQTGGPRPGRTRTALLLAAALVAAGGASAVIIPLASAADCTDVDVVMARGTGERAGLGGVVGDPLFAALEKENTGVSLSSHPVDYPASLAKGSAAAGNQELVDHVQAQAAKCPDQRFVLVGYSQGANVVDNSLGVSSAGAVVGADVVATIPAEAQAKVAAVMLFGNPIRKKGGSLGGDIGNRLLDVCANGDVICDPQGKSIQPHLSYGGNAGQAADFAANLITPGSSAEVIQPGTISGDPANPGAGAQQAGGKQAGGKLGGKLGGLKPGGGKLGGLKPGGGKLGGLKPGGGKLGGLKPGGGKLGGLKPGGGKLGGLKPGGGKLGGGKLGGLLGRGK